jgi:hypothetical protein
LELTKGILIRTITKLLTHPDSWNINWLKNSSDPSSVVSLEELIKFKSDNTWMISKNHDHQMQTNIDAQEVAWPVVSPALRFLYTIREGVPDFATKYPPKTKLEQCVRIDGYTNHIDYVQKKKDYEELESKPFKPVISRPLSIAFVVDITGSMQKYIQATKNAIKRIVGQATKAGVQTEFAFVGYRDHTNTDSDLLTIHQFTDSDTIENFLLTIMLMEEEMDQRLY